MVTIKELNETKYTLQDVHALIKEVYGQRAEEGIHFQALTMTTEELEQKIRQHSGVVVVAVDDQTQELMGTGTNLFHTDKHGQRFSGLVLAAVRPEAQGCGIGDLMWQRNVDYAREKGCVYISASTAEKAKSSVNFQLKHGEKKYGFFSSKDSDYYSILFRMYLIPTYKCSGIYCAIRYNLSKMWTKLLYHENGTRTPFGSFCHRIKKAIK